MSRFIGVFLVTAAVGFIALLPLRPFNHADVNRLVRMGRAPGRVLVVGDSVIAGYSHCDTDTASIPQMMVADLHEPVVDGSRPGSSLATSLDAVRVAALVRAFRVAVVPVTVNGGLFRSVRSGSDAELLWRDFVGGLRYAPRPRAARTPFKGRVYGGYEENAALYFTKERAAGTCPETAGSDTSFVEYMHWLSYGQPLTVSDGYEAFAARVQGLQQQGIAPLVVLPPVNYQLIERLNDPAVLATLRGTVNETEHMLRNAGVSVVNLSFALPSDVFADQFCACGHLTEQGRHAYAQRVAESVGGLLSRRE